MKSAYIPPQHDGIYTPADCTNHEYRYDGGGGEWEYCKKIVGDCRWICDHGKCPRGFQR